MKVSNNFEFAKVRRARLQREKQIREWQEVERERQLGELEKDKERLAEISKLKSKPLHEQYGIEEWTK